MPLSQSDAEQRVRETYDFIWDDWYEPSMKASRARLVFHWNDESLTGYQWQDDEIHLLLEDYDCEAMENERLGLRYPGGVLGWYPWKCFLVHEMIHEYQAKHQVGPTKEGQELRALHRRGFDGEGHGDEFYSAIANRATYFGVSDTELLAEL